MNPITNNLGSLTRELLSTEIRCEPKTAQEVCSEAGIPYTGAGLLVAATWLKAYKGDVNAAKLIREMTLRMNFPELRSHGELSKLNDPYFAFGRCHLYLAASNLKIRIIIKPNTMAALGAKLFKTAQMTAPIIQGQA